MSRRNLILLLALSAIWGSSFLFIKLGVRELSPSVVVLGRLAVGVGVLLPLAAFRGGLGALRSRDRILVVATLGLINNALPFWLLGFAETRIDSGLTAVIQAAAPIFTVLLAYRIDASQRVGSIQLVGVGIGFVGVALLVGVQRGGDVTAAIAVVATALCYAFSVLFAGRAAKGIPPLQLSIGQLGSAAIIMAPFGLAQLPAHLPGAGTVAAVAVLGALCSGVAYLLYFALIQGAGASKTILVTYLVPAFALVYGWLALGEHISVRALGGLALILAGTTLATGLARTRQRGR